jgi:hypothetical protein
MTTPAIEPKAPQPPESRSDIEFRQQPDGVIEILDHENGRRSMYDIDPFERDE